MLNCRVCIVVLRFCLFKHKTASEMRISDWSSDVCSSDLTGIFTVPPGHYFMMGDNRDNSQDSRVPVEAGGVGFVPAENLVGRAAVRWISIEPDASLLTPWTWFGAFRWNRMFTALRWGRHVGCGFAGD